MVPMRVAQDPRVGLASPELRLVYPQIFRAPLPGPDHVGAVVVRAQLLGGDPRAVAERVLREALERGLLVPEGDALVSVHRPRPRQVLPADPVARTERQRAQARERSKRYRAKDAAPEAPPSGSVTRHANPPLGSVTNPPVAPPSVTQSVTLPVAPKNEEQEDLVAPPPSPEFPGEEGTTVAVTAGATPPPPPSPSRVTRHASPERDGTPPGGEGVYPLPWEVVAGILGGGSTGRIGVAATKPARARLLAALADLEVTRDELVAMAKAAAVGKLRGQAERRVTDVGLLAPASGDATLLASWVNETRAIRAALERHAREEAARRRDTTPAGQGVLGLPQNTPEPTSNIVPAPTMSATLAGKLNALSSRLAAPARAMPPDTPPAVASGADPPPK